MFRHAPRITLADCLPWLWLHDERTIVTRASAGGSLLTCAHLVPQDLETVGPIPGDIYHDKLADLLGRLGAGWTIWVDQWRWRRPHYLPASDFGGCVAAQAIDAERREHFAGGTAKTYDNSVFISLQYDAEQADYLFEYLIGAERAAPGDAAILERYQEAVTQFLGELSRIVPRVDVLEGDALLSYLSQTVNYDPWPVSAAGLRAWLAEHIGTATWRTGLRPQIGDQHVRTVELFSLGPLTYETFDFLHGLPFECRWVVRMESMSREAQSQHLAKLAGLAGQKRKNVATIIAEWFSRRPQEDTNLAAAAKEAEAKAFRLRVQMAEMGFGRVTANIHAFATEPDAAEARAQDIAIELNGRGCRAQVARLNATYALLADIPGNGASDRNLPAWTAQIARVMPVTGIVRGAATDAKWKERRDGREVPAPALLMARSLRGLPVYFAFHAPGQDVGNTTVIGQSGGGKSALLAYMALASQRYQDATVLYFDRHRSFLVPCLCAGGDWIELGGNAGAAVQPLRNIHDLEQMEIAREWCYRALERHRIELTTEVKHAIMTALHLLSLCPPDKRTISGLVQRIGESRIARDGMALYRGGMLDGVVSSYASARLVGIECDAILRLDIAGLVLSAVFDAIRYERLRTGAPFVVIFDEAQDMLRHPSFLPEIDFLARQVRKHEGVLVMAAQAQSDFQTGPETKAIFDQCKNYVYVPDPNAARETQTEFMRQAGLEEGEIRAISHGFQKGGYFFMTPQYRRMLTLRFSGESLAVCGRSTPRDKLMAQTMLAQGIKPGPDFLRAWLDYAGTDAAGEEAA